MITPPFQRPWRLLLLSLAVLGSLFAAGSLAARAQEAPAFVPVWVDETSKLSDQTLQQALDGIAAQQAAPQHIVILIHGFDVPRADSTAQFDGVARLLQAQFAKSGRTVAVVGVQWPSDVDVSLVAMAGAYLGKVPEARSVGRLAVRQLLLGIRDRFPNANVNIMGHSMGCEITAAAMFPTMKYKEGDAPVPDGFRVDQEVTVNAVVLAGSDLDYDQFYVGAAATPNKRAIHLGWMTMSEIVGDDRDEVLQMRKMVRGKAGGGTIPRMSQEQYDRLFSSRAVVYDNQDIPKSHDFVKYYDEERIARLAPAIVFVAEPKGAPEPKELQELDQVLAMPDQVAALAPWLDSPNLSTQLYALWRLEKMLCGGSQHLANEYLSGLAYMLRTKPRKVLTERKSPDCPCQTVKQGIWPTVKQLTAAGAPPWANP